jgi:murein DD-endopeptidase MepM/ murein hydrolase activator NlpD
VKHAVWWTLGAVVVVAVVANSKTLEVVLPQKRVPTDPKATFSSRVVMPFADMSAVKVLIRYLGHYGNPPPNHYREGYGYHSGVDWNGRDARRGYGMPVRSIADGIVSDSSPVISPKGYGNMVLIWHPALKIWTRYAHLARRDVKAGQAVQAGQTIGTMGISGTDNTHLHFDVIQAKLPRPRYAPGEDLAAAKRYFIDPLQFLNSRDT